MHVGVCTFVFSEQVANSGGIGAGHSGIWATLNYRW